MSSTIREGQKDVMEVTPANREERKRMKAVVNDRYGPPEVQRLEQVEAPVPKEDEVLVRIYATTVNRTDCGVRSASPFFVRIFTGLRRPKRRILGMELAGEVQAVGATVTEFAAGDRVFGVKGSGAHAELVCMKQSAALSLKPSGMSFEEAAAVCDGACSALSCLRGVDLRKGRSILVFGASGSIGTAGVQLARSFGAEVTAVCNTKNLELVKSLGADEVIDYTQEDFTKNGKTYDVIFDAVGKHSFRRCKGSLKTGGTYIATDGLHNAVWALWTWRIGNKKAVFGISRYKKEDVLLLKDLIDEGKYRAVIDRTYPLEDVVEATRYVETGQKTGNVVLIVKPGAV
jgi:NADPH:quinone reductase-like Zn-dependent oxidoreductase